MYALAAVLAAFMNEVNEIRKELRSLRDSGNCYRNYTVGVADMVTS